MTRHLVLALVALLLSATAAGAEIYSYVDNKGTTHFVDDPGKIPKKLNKKKRVVDGAPPGDAAPNATGVRVHGNQVLVSATLHHKGNAVPATFLIDTGATTTTISDTLAKKLGIQSDSGKVVVGQVVGGGLIAVMRVRLDRMDVGPKSRTDMEVDVVHHNGPPVQFDGLLGMNFLRNYHYVIDVGSHMIRWQ